MKWIIGITLIFLIFSGCASPLKTPMPPIVETSFLPASEKLTEEPAEPPFWVLANKRGVGEYFENGSFYGVGTSRGENESKEIITSADDRARNNLAGLFRSFQESLAESFSGEGIDKINTQGAGKKNILSGIQKLTATLLLEVEIIEHWKDPSGDQIYSLAKVDNDIFFARLNNYQPFSRMTQETIKIRSDKLFLEMEQDLKRKSIMTRSGVGNEKHSGRLYLY